MKTILITGCSSGIGLTCAHKLADDGWDVHATVRKPGDLIQLKRPGITGHVMDYADTASIHKAFSQVRDQTGDRLFALFNNGGYGQPGAVEDITTDVLREQFETNVFGWHELTNLALPLMRQHGEGRIIHCSSVLGWVPAPYRGAYVASKHAVEGLASTMRLELAGTNIKISLIEPGPIATRFSENALAKFEQHIDRENSAHQIPYEKELKRLTRQGTTKSGSFRLPPEAVYRKLHHALTAKNPKTHYPVTVPTHVMNFARRFLPQSMVDAILIKGA